MLTFTSFCDAHARSTKQKRLPAMRCVVATTVNGRRCHNRRQALLYQSVKQYLPTRCSPKHEHLFGPRLVYSLAFSARAYTREDYGRNGFFDGSRGRFVWDARLPLSRMAAQLATRRHHTDTLARAPQQQSRARQRRQGRRYPRHATRCPWAQSH